MKTDGSTFCLIFVAVTRANITHEQALVVEICFFVSILIIEVVYILYWMRITGSRSELYRCA